jgi:hypothetical protein
VTEIPALTVKENPLLAIIELPVLIGIGAVIEEKVRSATPVDGVACFLTTPKFFASLSRSEPNA